MEPTVGHGSRRLFLEHLSPEAGVELLRSLSVHGTARELRTAAADFGGHALALTLLGRYLGVVHNGEIRKRDLVPHLTEEPEQGGHARRVMASYETWLQGKPELDILYVMGLFDRPVPKRAIDYLLKKGFIKSVLNLPAIKGLTENIQNLSEAQWSYAVQHLRELKLLAPADDDSDTLDCHPLVREHFGERLRQQNPEAWRQAHGRLYDYYKGLPEKLYGKHLPDTLQEMEPLFAAVAHGCLAGKHQAVLDEVYWERIRRKAEAYTVHKLGAFGADLAALANFFDPPWDKPAAGLSDMWKAAALSWAGFGLRALGRLREAAAPMQAAMERQITRKDWTDAARIAGNLSELVLTLGEVARAVDFARKSVAFADRSGDWASKMMFRTTLADALHQAGELDEAEKLFRDAEAMQQEEQPQYRYLYSLRGYRYCDLLLSRGQVEEVLQRAEETLKLKEKSWYSLLSIALDYLSLGRAYLLQAQGTTPPFIPPQGGKSVGSPLRRGDRGDVSDAATLQKGRQNRSPLEGGRGGVKNSATPTQSPARTTADSRLPSHDSRLPTADSRLTIAAKDHLDRTITGLREAGTEHNLPWGLLARAALFRVQQNFPEAWDDLSEAQEIAERGEMRLHLVDFHLEACRLVSEQYSVNSGQFSEASDQYSVNSDQFSEASEHVQQAAELVQETGYHRRDGEVELCRAQVALLRGEKAAAQEHLHAAREWMQEKKVRMWDWELVTLSEALESGR